MKTTGLRFGQIAVAIALLLAGATQNVTAQTASTDTVGFITLSIQGGGTPASPTLSLISPTLTQGVLWRGEITGVSIPGTTLTVSGTPWVVDQFNGAAGSHYVELISTATPAISGTLADITATSQSTITTFPATGAAIGDTIKIRKDVTIANLFGATNSAGLLAANDPASADEILIYSGSTFTSYYYYYNGVGDTFNGWRKSDDFSDATNVSIAPNEAVVIKRKANAPVPFVFCGAAKTGNTLIPILNGLNVLGTASAKGLTLATSGLYTGNNATGVKSSDDAASADEIILYSGTGQANYYYYSDASHLFDGWKDLSFNSADNIPIAPGTAFVLRRKSGALFNWVLPSPSDF